MAKANSCLSLFLIAVSFVLVMIVYVYYRPVQPIANANFKEKYNDGNQRIPASNITVYQGATVPNTPPKPIVFDTHESLPTIDGTQGSDKSMFMMAFNKCDPSCCPSTYSCSGGCVCMTNEQKKYLGNRGNNGKTRSCTNNQEY